MRVSHQFLHELGHFKEICGRNICASDAHWMPSVKTGIAFYSIHKFCMKCKHKRFINHAAIAQVTKKIFECRLMIFYFNLLNERFIGQCRVVKKYSCGFRLGECAALDFVAVVSES